MAHWPSDLRIVHKYFFFGGGERGRISEAIDDPPVNFSMTVEEEEPGTEQMTETEAISQQHLAPLTHNGSQQVSSQPLFLHNPIYHCICQINNRVLMTALTQ